MSSDTEELSKSLRRLRAVTILTLLGFVSHQIGELFQEVAALVFIFVPLELWDKRGHDGLIKWTLFGTLLSFITGVLFRGASAAIYRLKKDLEGHYGNG